MVATNVRILSDVHYGEPTSRVRSLGALRPLFAGADRVVLNGDSLQTGGGSIARASAHLRQHFLEFVQREVPGGVLLTGNHDADISTLHHLDLLGGLVFVTHGEILFEDLVPWSADLLQLRELYRRELAALAPPASENLETRLAACKRACAQLRLPPIPHSRSPWARTVRIARKFWPPRRGLAMLQAWHELPRRAAALVRAQRPRARFAVVGHTHLRGVWVRQDIVVINTGSFCPPFKPYAVDVSPEQVVVRCIWHHRGCFNLGRVVAAFALAPDRDGAVGSSATVPEFVPVP
jgi:predicted phosphodiesterase